MNTKFRDVRFIQDDASSDTADALAVILNAAVAREVLRVDDREGGAMTPDGRIAVQAVNLWGKTFLVAVAALTLSGCAATRWYEAHVKPLPCEPGLCTDEQWDAEERLTITVDLGAQREPGRVTVEP